MDPDMEELPTDYTAGVDFRLNKTSPKAVTQTMAHRTWARTRSSTRRCKRWRLLMHTWLV